MQAKLFQIRLSDDHLNNDQELLNNFMEKVIIKKTSTQFVNSEPVFWSVILYYDDLNPEKIIVNTNAATNSVNSTEEKSLVKTINVGEENAGENNESSLTNLEEKRLEALKQWRTKIANEQKLPGYVVSTNSDLLQVVKKNPKTLDELTKIKGFGPKKVAKYGNAILTLLESIPVAL